MQRWYVARNGAKEGPYSPSDLRRLAQEGQLRASDMLLRDGAAKWISASAIKGLFAERIGSVRDSGARSSQRGSSWTRALVLTLSVLLILAIVAAACLHFIHLAEFRKLQSTTQADLRAHFPVKEPVTELLPPPAEEKAPASELPPPPPQPRIQELEAKIREADAKAAGLEARVAELTQKESEARQEAEALKQRLADTENDAAANAAALAETIKALSKRLDEAHDKKRGAYDFIDKHVLETPPGAAQSLKSLALYLTAPATDERTKARAIYRWITANIDYDVDAFFEDRKSDNAPQAVLKARKCVCEGYANLFVALAKLAGLEAVKVQGQAHGYGYEPGAGSEGMLHAWNAVRINGAWQLVDATWGAGAIDPDKKYVRSFREFYFLTPPDQFILTHLPNEPRWQLLPEPVSVQQFARWPKADARLFEYGISAKQLRDKMSEPGVKALVKAFHAEGIRLTILKAPLDGILKAGASLHVRFDAPTAQNMLLTAGDKKTPLTRKGTIFEGRIDSLPPGPVRIFAQPTGSKVYHSVLEYGVE